MILFTKLNIPKAVFPVQHRKRLTDKLNKGIIGSLTLVDAMAGSGKSTLVGDWLIKEGLPHVWYSLEDSDNDLRSFLLHLTAGFQKLRPEFGRQIEDALSTSESPLLRNILIELVNEINLFPEPVIIVLDDYHWITLQEIHDTVTFLVEHYHPKFRLVIISRNQLPISTQKLKVRKQFTEISFEDICFRDIEIQQLYRDYLNVDLNLEQAGTIFRKTEGWIAAIQLLSQTDTKERVDFLPETISGKKPAIIQYLMEEVMSGVPKAVCDFLTKTAVLDRFCLPLCEHLDVVPENASFAGNEEILHYLLKRNLFIVPLDDEQLWFRYHHLFKDFLLSCQIEKGQLEDICQKASEWFECQGLFEESVEYAMRCNDQDKALQLLEQQIWSNIKTKYNYHIYQPLKRFKDKIDNRKLGQFPMLALFLAANEIFSPNRQDVRFYIDIAKNRNRENSAYPIETYIQVCEHLEILRNNLCWGMSDHPLKDLMSILENQDDIILVQLNCFIHAMASRSAYYRDGDINGAEYYLNQAGALAKRNQLVPVFQSVVASLAQLKQYNNPSHAISGILNDGIVYEEEQQSSSWRNHARAFPNNTSFNTVASRYYYKRNELSKAKRHIEQCFNALSEKQTDPIFTYGIHYSLVELALGNEKVALSILKEAILSRQDHSGNLFTSPAVHFESLCTCLHFLRRYTGLDWLEEVVHSMLHQQRTALRDARGPVKDLAGYLEASWLEYRGKHDAAVSKIEELIQSVNKSIKRYLSTRLTLLLARINYHRGEEAQAKKCLDRALIQISGNNMIRLCIDEGEWVNKLLKKHRGWTAPGWLIETLQSGFVSPSGVEPRSVSRVVGDIPDAALLEPIRERERVILDLLSRALSYKEIASEMNYSFSTIQSYIRDMYGKLGVHSRQEAVNKAKALGLL